MKNFLLLLVAAVAILVVAGFVMGYISYSKQDGAATITVDTDELENAKQKTREATADVFEDVGDAARKGGRKMEEAGNKLQQETGNEPDAGR
jgi:Flp pilus assembly protein TadB